MSRRRVGTKRKRAQGARKTRTLGRRHNSAAIRRKVARGVKSGAKPDARAMRRLVLAALISLAGVAAFAAPSLRTQQAQLASQPMARLHPVTQALNFLIPEPDPAHFEKTHELWATWYHMPRLRAVHDTEANALAAPLLGRNGEAVSPPLSRRDWCTAAMQGSVWVVDADGAATPYVFVDARGPEQVDCDAHFGNLSPGVKAATRRARFEPFRHPLGCDARPQPLMPWRTVASDPRVIPMGSILFIPELRGRGFWMDGRHFVHDGYVVASDRGGAIRGRHIDMFVPESAGQPFPDLIASSPQRRFTAHVVSQDAFAPPALRSAARELCRDIPLTQLVRRPWAYSFLTDGTDI